MIPPCNATWNLLPGQQNHECNHHPNSEDEESSTYLTSLSANFGGMNSSSTLHCRGKNGRSKKIGQTNQKMIHFVPNMYVSGKISALRPGTQTVMIFGTTKKIRKLPKTTRFQDLRVFAGFCGFLRAFCGFFAGFCGFIPSHLMRCKHFLAFVSPNPKTCNQSPKIQDLGVLGKISRYRSNSENTYIFLGFGGSR